MKIKSEIDQSLVQWAYSNLNSVPKCEEYEKMILSCFYKCQQKELWVKRTQVQEQAADYALMKLADFENDVELLQKGRVAHLLKFMTNCQQDTVIVPPFTIDYGCNVVLGKRFWANYNLTLLDEAIITFGENVLIGPNVTFTTAAHPVEAKLRWEEQEYAQPITVGDNCWFGANVTVLPGVTIGDGCVIGAGSIVTKDIPAHSVVVGTPAKIIRQLEAHEYRK